MDASSVSERNQGLKAMSASDGSRVEANGTRLPKRIISPTLDSW